MRNNPQDYAQTAVLSKLITGCPLERSHRCPVCRREIERQTRKLFKSFFPIITPDYSPDNVRLLTNRAARQETHRKFLEMWNPSNRVHKSKRKSVNWYAKHFGVGSPTIEKWMKIERQRVKGIDRLGKP